MARKHVLDRLADAVEAERALRLTADDAALLAEEFVELEEAREIDAILYDQKICELQGVTSKLTH